MRILKDYRLLLFGMHFLILAGMFYCISFLAWIVSLFLGHINQTVYVLEKLSFVCFVLFVVSAIINILFGKNVENKWLIFKPITDFKICVSMTAYNDEKSIGDSVREFKSQPNVEKVIVIDNNSNDNTSEEARKAGAIAVRETVQGYGSCCIRALKEASRTGCNIICLVEGDGTFASSDLRKMVAYIENGDMVLGTRTTRELNTPDSQMNTFIRWGNVFMAKLLQTRFWKVRFTDVGCTFRIIRREPLERIWSKLTILGNHFLCNMNLVALEENLKIIEVPVTFRKRVGKSKGVGGNFFKALITGMKMWGMILFK